MVVYVSPTRKPTRRQGVSKLSPHARDSFPYRFGAKIHPSHHVDRELYAHNPEYVPFVACKFHRSSWFVNNKRDEFLSPEQDLFVMTYEDDSHILGREPTEEVNRFEELEGIADGAFAGDRFTYGGMNRREIVKEIEESVQRQLAAHQLINEQGIDMPLYPSIMGWKDWHYERCRTLLEEISRSVGFDATQYNSGYRLAEHVRTLDEILDPDQIFVNGCIAPNRLRMLPESVRACSGNWEIREESKNTNGIPQRDELPRIVERRNNALNHWQSKLIKYT